MDSIFSSGCTLVFSFMVYFVLFILGETRGRKDGILNNKAGIWDNTANTVMNLAVVLFISKSKCTWEKTLAFHDLHCNDSICSG